MFHRVRGFRRPRIRVPKEKSISLDSRCGKQTALGSWIPCFFRKVPPEIVMEAFSLPALSCSVVEGKGRSCLSTSRWPLFRCLASHIARICKPAQQLKQAGKTIDEEAALVRKALTASAALGVRRRGALFESWNGSRPSRKRKLLAQNPKDQPKDTCRRSEQTRSRAFCFSGKA